MQTVYDDLLPTISTEDLRRAAAACRWAAQAADDDEWGAPEAYDARAQTEQIGWVWDFSTWSNAAAVLFDIIDDRRRIDEETHAYQGKA